ncbi:anti-sigma factor domain-containing protein [Paenibacillus donghaensis]|uniref:Anti-sigma-W factor RsiW n=1 Tax=Paenibacillus donghaensis TaxID=414771 RepID=A0A2Z2KH25_9BACL|nr:anti-sigma factor [Paenibacillus donghaensis]ASA25524.1 hypothetical protein B9T62_35215 [Paenibacillus donghaensis]
MDNTDKELCEWAEMYALGGLDEAEKLRFEQHMLTCAECREQVQELRAIIELLPLASAEVAPPSGMKSRVLGHVLSAGGAPGQQAAPVVDSAAGGGAPGAGTAAAVNSRPSPAPVPAPSTPSPAPRPYPISVKRGRRLRTLAAGIAAVAAALAIYSAVLQRDISGLRQELAAVAQERAGLQQQLALAQAPSTELKVNEVVQLGPAAEDIVASGLATIVIDAKGTHLLVQAEKLPELTGSEAYQVWLIKGDVKQSAGTFLASQGTGAMYYTFDPQGYDTVAITLEPDGQGEQPRGKPILVAAIEG